MHIYGRPKYSGNIVGFRNNIGLVTKYKQPKCIFEGREVNWVFMCEIKTITVREELLVNYYLNQIDTTNNTTWVLMLYHLNQPIINALYILYLTFFLIFHRSNYIIMW